MESHSSTLSLASRLAGDGWDVSVVVYGVDTLAAASEKQLRRTEGDDVLEAVAGRVSRLLGEYCSRGP